MPRALAYAIPIAVCLAVHWLALRTWFYLDDFAWLGLKLQVHSASDLLPVLFKPAAQGTVRVFSERLFFLIFSSLFGLNAWAFKAWVFLTHFASLCLLVQIAQRITGSQLAAVAAATLWTTNAGLAIALGWTSAYNEVAFAFCTLLAFRLLLLAIDTGRRRYWIAQWAVFLLSFGVLELTVTYPALAAGYTLCCARTHLRKALWLFIPSIVYMTAHLLLVPRSSDPSYGMHFDGSMALTFWRYWSFALGALRPAPVDWRPLWLGLSLALALTAGLVFFAAKLRDWRGVFLLAWFAIVLSPVAPLRDHFTEYYVTVPAIGLAILGGWAISRARVIGPMLAAVYVVVSVTDIRTAATYYVNFSAKLKQLVMGVAALPPSERGKPLVIDGVDNEMFWLGLSGNPLQLVGAPRFYLKPGTEAAIDPHPEWGGISKHIITRNEAAKLYLQNEANFVDVSGKPMSYEVVGQAVEVADAQFAGLLGPTWHEAESGFRWMPRRATVRLKLPAREGMSVEVTGYTPAAVLKQGPLELSVKANGKLVGTSVLKMPDEHFTFKLPLPQITGSELEIGLETSRTIQAAGDPRQLGIIIKSVAVL